MDVWSGCENPDGKEIWLHLIYEFLSHQKQYVLTDALCTQSDALKYAHETVMNTYTSLMSVQLKFLTFHILTFMCCSTGKEQYLLQSQV